MTGNKPDGEVTIVAGGKKVSGWTEVEIGGGLDRAPACFSLGMTERYPGEAADVILTPGDPCEIRIGGDLVIAGYVNRIPRSLGPRQHQIRVEGRSRVQDLVDCSALIPNLSAVNQSIGSLARLLVAEFDGPINVLTPDGDGDGKPYAISITLGETPWEVISQVATYEGLLVHDDARGNLVICKVGTTKTASGFTEGENVQSAEAGNDDSTTYQRYVPALMSQDTLSMIGPGGNKAGNPVNDPMVKRRRGLVVISDQPVQGVLLAQKRAVWEATRRRGRARSVTLTCDSWRDTAGTLWTHNVLAPVHIPTLRINREEWIIAEWSLRRSQHSGTTARLTLMPPDAFSVEPTSLNNETAQIRARTAEEQRHQAIGTAAIQADASRSITAPNAGAGGNVRAGDGYGI